jgi:hypothetical protein
MQFFRRYRRSRGEDSQHGFSLIFFDCFIRVVQMLWSLSYVDSAMSRNPLDSMPAESDSGRRRLARVRRALDFFGK